MTKKPSRANRAEILMTGVAMGESPRWHENRLWFSDWGAHEILAVDPKGKREVKLRVPFGLPFCIDWLRDGRMLVVSGRDGLLLRRERDGALVTHATLQAAAGMGWNEIVVDGRNNAYINGGDHRGACTPCRLAIESEPKISSRILIPQARCGP